MKNLLLAATALVCATQCQAADIKMWPRRLVVEPFEVIEINGQLVAGDTDKFKAAIASLAIRPNTRTRTLVILSSKGGDPVEGINIGQIIHTYRFETMVGYTDVCASSCALIWLAGYARTMASDSKIGFHAVYYIDDKSVSSEGNAMVGGYLNRLGFGYPAIRYFTQAPPYSMEWLTPAKARAIGLEVDILADKKPTTPPFAQQRDTPTTLPFTPSGTDCRNLGYRYWSKIRGRCE
jgi:hypothetical protein